MDSKYPARNIQHFFLPPCNDAERWGWNLRGWHVLRLQHPHVDCHSKPSVGWSVCRNGGEVCRQYFERIRHLNFHYFFKRSVFLAIRVSAHIGVYCGRIVGYIQRLHLQHQAPPQSPSFSSINYFLYEHQKSTICQHKSINKKLQKDLTNGRESSEPLSLLNLTTTFKPVHPVLN